MKVATEIKACLDALSPTHLEVINESHEHNVPPNSETHFKLIIVSDFFDTLSLVKRHQLIYSKLTHLMQSPIHALSLHTLTPKEWEHKRTVAASPKCLGGKARENRSN